MSGLLRKLLGSNADHDGYAARFEAAATGLDPLAELARDDNRDVRVPRRAPAQPRDILTATLAQKTLHSWLQNRHQTLYPLTINFRTLSPPQRGSVLRLMAIALLSGINADPHVNDDARTWLRNVGASDADLAQLQDALDTPPPLNATIAAVQECDLGTYAYAVSLIAARRHDNAGQMFLDYIAARFAVPSNVIRSIQRRYRI